MTRRKGEGSARAEIRAPGTIAGRPLRRWPRPVTLAAGLLPLAVAALLHQPLLRTVYAGIVCDQSTTEATHGMILFGDAGSIDSVGRLIREGQLRKAVIVELRPSRAVRIGAAPRFATIVTADLKRRGVAESAIDVISTDATSHHAAIQEVHQRIAPDVVIVIPCPRHASRHLRGVIDTVLEEPDARRISVLTVPVTGFDENRWWLSRTGTKRVVSAYLRLLHLRFIGLHDVDSPEWDPDDYELALRGNA